MIRINSKTHITIASMMVAVSLVVPSFAFAREMREAPRGMDGTSNTDSKPVGPEKRGLFNRKDDDKRKVKGNGLDGSNFCARLDMGTQKIGQEFDRLSIDLKGKRDEQFTKLEEHRTLIDERFATSREKWETNRVENFDKLMARATTDAQKAAVTVFKAAIETALKIRYAAVDSARKTYKDGVDALFASRKTALESAKTTLKTASEAAMAKAKADCTLAGADGGAIKLALETALKTARDAFKVSTQSLEKPNEALDALQKTRDESIKKAQDAFKVAQTTALNALKLAFPEETTPKTQ